MESLFFILFIFWVFVSLIVSMHANGQGKTSLWGGVVFLFGIFGMIGYAISLASD